MMIFRILLVFKSLVGKSIFVFLILRENRQETDGIQFLAAKKNKEMIFILLILSHIVSQVAKLIFCSFLCIVEESPGEEAEIVDIVKFAGLTNDEKLEWINRVTPYLQHVNQNLEKSKVTKFFMLNLNLTKRQIKKFKKIVKKENPSITYFHTGSICQQVGKPGVPYQLITAGQGDSENPQPFPLMITDHDVMFEENHIRVAEERRGKGFWLKMNSTKEPECNQYLTLTPMIGHTKVLEFLPNNLLPDLMRRILVNVFAKAIPSDEEKFSCARRQVSFAAREREMVLASRLSSRRLSRQLSQTVRFERNGPANNIKIHGGSDKKNMFNCDFLLCLRSTVWPRQVIILYLPLAYFQW